MRKPKLPNLRPQVPGLGAIGRLDRADLDGHDAAAQGADLRNAAKALAALASAAVMAIAALAVAMSVSQSAAACGVPLAVQRSAGDGFAAVLMADGSVWLEAGSRQAPELKLTRVALLQGIVQLATDGPSLYARQSDGRVWSWQPSAPAMPRPVQGLPGKATLLTARDDGRLWVHVRAPVLPTDGEPAAERQIALRLDGPVALANTARLLRYASNDLP